MRFTRVGGKVFTWNGQYIREYRSNRVYDPKTGEAFIGVGEKRLPISDFAYYDAAEVMEWKRDAATAYNILQTPDFMSIEVI